MADAGESGEINCMEGYVDAGKSDPSALGYNIAVSLGASPLHAQPSSGRASASKTMSQASAGNPQARSSLPVDFAIRDLRWLIQGSAESSVFIGGE